MTSKRGTLWKSSWNRGRGTPIPDTIGNMFFFRDFYSGAGANQASYETAALSTLGDTLPFWFALVGMRSSSTLQQISGPSFAARVSSVTDSVVGAAFVPPVGFQLNLPVAGDDYVSAVFAVATAVGATYSIRVILDNQISDYEVSGAAFASGPSPLVLSPFDLPGAVHGWAGGRTVPTLAEIQQWFMTLKTSLKIPEIPGKTTHRYSAADVVGVPAVLPNIGSDGAAQDMSLLTAGAPTPVNVQIPVRFAY